MKKLIQIKDKFYLANKGKKFYTKLEKVAVKETCEVLSSKCIDDELGFECKRTFKIERNPIKTYENNTFNRRVDDESIIELADSIDEVSFNDFIPIVNNYGGHFNTDFYNIDTSNLPTGKGFSAYTIILQRKFKDNQIETCKKIAEYAVPCTKFTIYDCGCCDDFQVNGYYIARTDTLYRDVENFAKMLSRFETEIGRIAEIIHKCYTDIGHLYNISENRDGSFTFSNNYGTMTLNVNGLYRNGYYIEGTKELV